MWRTLGRSWRHGSRGVLLPWRSGCKWPRYELWVLGEPCHETGGRGSSWVWQTWIRLTSVAFHFHWMWSPGTEAWGVYFEWERKRHRQTQTDTDINRQRNRQTETQADRDTEDITDQWPDYPEPEKARGIYFQTFKFSFQTLCIRPRGGDVSRKCK